jgi:protein-S-isoprenylcysteine O-methyltransferase Ste14
MQIKWKNIPIPAGHVIPMVLGMAAHQSIPEPLDMVAWLRYALGFPLVLAGLLLAGWSVREAGAIEIDAPVRLITSGPYALSRNPMYMAWNLIYAGTILLVNSRWLLLLFTFVLAFTHYREILREESNLEERFGEEYRKYTKNVRRYF